MISVQGGVQGKVNFDLNYQSPTIPITSSAQGYSHTPRLCWCDTASLVFPAMYHENSFCPRPCICWYLHVKASQFSSCKNTRLLHLIPGSQAYSCSCNYTSALPGECPQTTYTSTIFTVRDPDNGAEWDTTFPYDTTLHLPNLDRQTTHCVCLVTPQEWHPTGSESHLQSSL